jgi:hypothetical protein
MATLLVASWVVVKDSAESPWRIDVSFGPSSLRTEALARLTLTTDGFWNRVPPVTLLVAGPSDQDPSDTKWATGWTRDDETGGSAASRVAAGLEQASPSSSVEGGLYRGVDGVAPRWERVYRNYDPRYPTWNQTDRGITAVPAADGSGREVILTGVEWPPEPVIVRIEPHDGHRAVTELDYNQYFTEVFGRPPQILGGSKENPHAGVQAAALNMFEPFVDPLGGGVQRFVTLFLVHPDDPAEGHNGAYFLIRRAPGVYDWGEIPSGLPAGENLRGTRTVERSPFPDEPHVWYFGGNFAGPDVQPPRPNTAWIYKGTFVPPGS